MERHRHSNRSWVRKAPCSASWFGQLVTILQNAARGAAKPSERTSSEGFGSRGDQLRRPGSSAFAKATDITFPLLSDAGSATIKRYRLLNPVPEWALGPNKDDPEVKAAVQKYVSVVNPNATMVGIAFPGTFILDRQGRVISRYFEDFYIERNTISSIMMRLNDRDGLLHESVNRTFGCNDVSQ